MARVREEQNVGSGAGRAAGMRPKLAGGQVSGRGRPAWFGPSAWATIPYGAQGSPRAEPGSGEL